MTADDIPARGAASGGNDGGLTAETVRLVRETFDLVRPQADNAVAAFYRNLFTARPDMEGRFPQDMGEQRRKFVAMLTVAVGTLERPEILVPRLRELSQEKHRGFTGEDYNAVGGVLLQTLREFLGERFTPEVEAAWTAVYGFMAQTMIEAANPPAA